jgi:hypothetical protein
MKNSYSIFRKIRKTVLLLSMAGLILYCGKPQAQNVGITDAPSITPNYLLQIHNNAASGNIFQLTNTTSGTGTSDGFKINLNTGFHIEFNNQENSSISFWTNNLRRMTIHNNGYVGIGTLPFSLSQLTAYKNADSAKCVIRGIGRQSSTATGYQNIGVMGFGSGTYNGTNWRGISIGVVGIANYDSTNTGYGIYGGFGNSTAPTFYDGALNAGIVGDGANVSFAGYFNNSARSAESGYFINTYTTDLATYSSIGLLARGGLGTGSDYSEFVGGTGAYLFGLDNGVVGVSNVSSYGLPASKTGGAFVGSDYGVIGCGNVTSAPTFPALNIGGFFYGEDAGVYAKRNNPTAAGTTYFGDGGTKYTIYATLTSQPGSTADMWHFANIGELRRAAANTPKRSGGVLGTYYQDASNYGRGMLGYVSTTPTIYGGYFYGITNYAGGANKNLNPAIDSTEKIMGVGIGVYGSNMGAHIWSENYGLNVRGEKYCIYSDGKTFTNNYIAQLDSLENGNRIATYMTTSPTVDIICKGKTILSNGKASIIYDRTFADLVSDKSDVIITVTPIGKCNGVYISDLTKNGFTIEEQNDGKSSIEVNWIAIGTKKGYENPLIPQEVLSKDFDIKMRELYDADKDANSDIIQKENFELKGIIKKQKGSKKEVLINSDFKLINSQSK